MQSMMIDYFRYGYLQFVLGKRSADANASETVRGAYEAVSWRQFVKKLGLRNYLNYTRQQEALAPNLLRLRLATREAFPDWLDARLSQRLQAAREMVQLPRDQSAHAVALRFPASRATGVVSSSIEITALNVVLVFVLLRHEAVFRSLLARLQGAR